MPACMCELATVRFAWQAVACKEKKRKDYAFWRQFNVKPSIIRGVAQMLRARLIWLQYNTQPEECLLQLTHQVVVIKECSILHILSFLLATVLTDVEMPCSVAQPVNKLSITVALV